MRPTRTLSPQPWMTAPETRAVVDALTAKGAEVRFVGGCVRDALLGRPISDIDIATASPPDEVMALLSESGIKVVPTGFSHGTVTAVSHGRPFEVTTLREDVETDGRRAVVAFSDDWRADAARRDLTINAMSLTPDGALYDPFGGAADLEAGRIRFVGDAATRIAEDVLRLLRFFRFYAHYGRSPPDAAGLAACRDAAHLLPTLSAERVWAEFEKLLAAPDPASVLELMHGEDILRHALPEASRFDRLRRLAAAEPEPDRVRRLAAVLDVDLAGAATVAERLRLSNADRSRLTFIADRLPGFRPLTDAGERRRWFYAIGPGPYEDLLRLHAADGAEETDPDLLRQSLAHAAAWRQPTLPVAGRDVLALGISPGPQVGALVAEVEDWWISQDFKPDRAACLAHLRSLLE